MLEIRYTLVSDGSSDRALLPILTWALRENQIKIPIQPAWADLRRLPTPPSELSDRIARALILYPCDLLFVHRDAESSPRSSRVDEILRAVESASSTYQLIPPVVCVVPVRMQEAWLLIDETALRKAADNPNGRQRLSLPRLSTLEQLTDPKDTLYGLLRTASGLSGKRAKKFKANSRVQRLAEYISDYSSLRSLPAFRNFEEDLEQIIQTQSWNN